MNGVCHENKRTPYITSLSLFCTAGTSVMFFFLSCTAGTSMPFFFLSFLRFSVLSM